MSVHAKVGSNIKKERKKRGLTAAELGKGVGRSRSFISDIENGRSKISIDLLFDIAKYLDVPIYVLTGDSRKEYEEFSSKKNVMELEESLRQFREGLEQDVKWTFEGYELPREKAKEIYNQMKIILEIKRQEMRKRFKKRQSNS